MKQFLDILKFEFMGYVKSKIFLVVTALFIIAIGLILSFPRIITAFENDNKQPETEKQVIMLSDKISADNTLTLKIFQDEMQDNKIELTDKTTEELNSIIESEEIQGAIIINSPTEYTYMVKKLTLNDNTQYSIDKIMLKNFRLNSMLEFEIPGESANEILSTTIKSNVVQILKDEGETFLYTYLLIIALYMAILLYGQQVATSIASEKSSRAMEMLITSAKPENLMFGKIIGSGLAGLLQMTIILGSTVVFWNLNKQIWGDESTINSVFNMPPYLLLYTVLFFVLGFFIYAFLYGAVGSLASRVEDINTTSMPIIFLFVVAFIIVITSMTNGNVDSGLMLVASYVPFTSPMAMFARVAMSEVSPIEIIISVAILIASTFVIGYISAKIYRVGVLLYGKPPKMSSVFSIKTIKK